MLSDYTKKFLIKRITGDEVIEKDTIRKHELIFVNRGRRNGNADIKFRADVRSTIAKRFPFLISHVYKRLGEELKRSIIIH